MTYIHRQLEKPLCIIGAGDAAQSIYFLLKHGEYKPKIKAFLESDNFFQAREVCGLPVQPLSQFDAKKEQAFIALGSSQARHQMFQSLPADTENARFIHPQNQLLSPEDFEMGEGSVLFPYCIVSRQVTLGKHAIVLGHSILGHHGCFGDFFTAGAQFNSGGNCHVGERVFCGMSVSVRDRAHLGDDITVGMGSVVISSLIKPGVYWGNPAVWQKELSC